MSKPWIHSLESVKRHGGKPEDYLAIHRALDSSKNVVADNRHRIFTHNSWFISTIIPMIFGETAVNSDGNVYSTRDIAEEHCLSDFKWKFIPSASDYLNEMEMKDWMDNGRGLPPSCAKLYKAKKPVYEIQD